MIHPSFTVTFLRVAILLTFGLLPSSLVVAQMRTWVDSSGKHRVEAELVDFENGVVTLRNEDGKQIKLPIARLSDKDQAFVQQPSATTDDDQPKNSRPAAKPATAKPVAKRFYTALIDQDFDELKKLLTPTAQSNWDAAKTLLEGLDAPDGRQGVLIRTATGQDDMADVNVSIKVRGKFQRHHLQLRWSGSEWLVASLIPDGEDTDPINFEGSAGDRSESGEDGVRVARRGRSRAQDDEALDDEDVDDEEADSEDEDLELDEEESDERNVFRVPDGDANELLAFIEEVKRFKPPQSASRQELGELQDSMLRALLEAADKVFEADPSKSQAEVAAKTKLQALFMLSRISRDAEMARALEAFPQKLKTMGLDDLAQSAQSTVLNLAVANVGSANEAQDVVGRAREHLRGIEKLQRDEISLAQSAGRLAERIDNELATEVYTEFASLMDRDPTTKPLAEVMRGTARRLGLVGNPMELAGVTSADQPFDIAQLKGKVVLVDFWATWCGPCLQEMPNIRKNYEKYHELGFEVVAVSVDRDLNALKKFVEEESPPWLVLVDEHPQNAQKMGSYYGISAIPTTILLDSDGKVITFNCRGERLGAELERLLGREAS